MTELRLENVSVEREGRRILDNISTRFAAGEFVALLGANGAGKSTLVRTALGIINSINGKASIDNVDSRKLSAREKALKVAYLPQARSLSWPLTVADTVTLGRYAHGVRLG
ncbi:MAG: ABC transporter ATP-binding protein, partial [Gammaproteobacteria bacterium]|nr:ABC transporter ATP-binding protein [Gammaproteobacteria bacterium]